jgi:hypothetical protein
MPLLQQRFHDGLNFEWRDVPVVDEAEAERER